MRWFEGLTLRSVLFGIGAIGAAAEAVDIAMKDGFTVPELIAAGCVALACFAAKWPTDVTSADAKEREKRARRESMFPPGGEP